jgi:hypothetical protein
MDRAILERVVEGMPFEFLYDGVPSSECLQAWTLTREEQPCEGGFRQARTWTDGQSGLSVACTATRFENVPAVEWVLRFRNDGQESTPIIREVRDMDLGLPQALGDGSFTLHKLNGAPSNATDNEPSIVSIRPGATETLGGGGGRSSNKDFPFFRLDTGDGTLLVAVGWSGQWQASLSNDGSPSALRMKVGLEQTHFRLHPGESVRGYRLLITHEPTFWHVNHDVPPTEDDGSCYWSFIQGAEDIGHPVIRVNHGTSEEAGMVTMTQYINENIPGLRAEHLPHGCTFRLAGLRQGN